ncbi:hypothetical protein D3C85_1849490 [compost metagenome]
MLESNEPSGLENDQLYPKLLEDVFKEKVIFELVRNLSSAGNIVPTIDTHGGFCVTAIGFTKLVEQPYLSVIFRFTS